MRIKTQRHAIYSVPELEALWTHHIRTLTTSRSPSASRWKSKTIRIAIRCACFGSPT